MVRTRNMDDSNDVIVLLSSSENESSSDEMPKATTGSYSEKLSAKNKPRKYVLSPTTKIESKLEKRNHRRSAVPKSEESSDSEEEGEENESDSDYDVIQKPKATKRTTKVALTSNRVRSKAIEIDSDSDSNSDVIHSRSSSITGTESRNIGKASEDESEDESLIQVPDSSPQRRQKAKLSSGLDSSPPAKITTKLPNLNNFAWKEENDFSKTNYAGLKKMFPKNTT